jgi:hypothetical protein
LLIYSGPSALASVSCSAELKPSESDQMQSSCSYIEVNVCFKAVNDESYALNEDPDDIIESNSQPYLGWSVMD